ncbi:hypothetical protein [Serratia proteamaculans]
MTILGWVSEKDRQQSLCYTSYLPSTHFYEKHHSAPIYATPQAILDAVEQYDMRNDRVADVLMTVRELPGKALRLGRQQINPQPEFGLHTFTLLQRQDNQMSFGLAGRFWRPDMGIIALDDAADFGRLQDKGVARLVLHFHLLPDGEAWRLCTETFIGCPDTRTRLKLLPYWLLIRAASGLIRRRTLAAIRRQVSAPVRGR